MAAVADRGLDRGERRRRAVRRRLPPWVVGAAAVAGGAGAIAWTVPQVSAPTASPVPAAPARGAPAGLAATNAAVQRLQQQLAADTRRLAALVPAGVGGTASALPGSPLPATHATTGASGVP